MLKASGIIRAQVQTEFVKHYRHRNPRPSSKRPPRGGGGLVRLPGVAGPAELPPGPGARGRYVIRCASGARRGPLMSKRLYVGNLSYNITEQDLQEHFAPFGGSGAVVVTDPDGRSKGFGFVEVSDDQMQAA